MRKIVDWAESILGAMQCVHDMVAMILRAEVDVVVCGSGLISGRLSRWPVSNIRHVLYAGRP